MVSDDSYERYLDLLAYVGFSDDDARRIRAVAPRLEDRFPELIDDFYAEIQRHPAAMAVITGGEPQIERLRGTLNVWLRQLLYGPYDRDYVKHRLQVGRRHVEIGLDQLYTNAAMSRLRTGLTRILSDSMADEPAELVATIPSLNKLLDLDLAIIEDAYQAEHVLREQRNQRLATIGQLAAGLAHELRNPLNVIATSVYYLLNKLDQQGEPDEEKTRDHLLRIRRQVESASDVITALTDFARMPSPHMEPFRLDEFFRWLLETFEVPDSIELETDVPPALPMALGDRRQLAIVFSNLIRNAVDAMPDGGKLSVAARPSGAMVEVVVADNGVGISEEHVHRITDPLFSTKARGIGLGLALSKSIIQNHHGGLDVRSELGQGARFTVTILASTDKDNGG